MEVFGALDIGGTKTIAGLVTADGQILCSEQFPTDRANCHAHLHFCRQVLDTILNRYGGTLRGLGLTLPGIVDPSHSYLVHSAYPAWNGQPVTAMLQRAYPGIPIMAENDVNACALAELHFGYGDRYSDFLWVTVSTGIGGAVVCSRKLITGGAGFAGELGHIKVEFDHPLRCPSCGGCGCLEAHASGTALNALFCKTVTAHPQLLEALGKLNAEPDAKGCALLAQRKDHYAMGCFEIIGTYLGRGLSAGINLLNPQAVILGGGVAKSLPFMYNSIQHMLQQCVHPNLLPVDVVETKIGYQAALLGAATLVMK